MCGIYLLFIIILLLSWFTVDGVVATGTPTLTLFCLVFYFYWYNMNFPHWVISKVLFYSVILIFLTRIYWLPLRPLYFGLVDLAGGPELQLTGHTSQQPALAS